MGRAKYEYSQVQGILKTAANANASNERTNAFAKTGLKPQHHSTSSYHLWLSPRGWALHHLHCPQYLRKHIPLILLLLLHPLDPRNQHLGVLDPRCCLLCSCCCCYLRPAVPQSLCRKASHVPRERLHRPWV